MWLNINSTALVIVDGENVKEVESFVYLGRVVDKKGGKNKDVTIRISKSPAIFIMF